MFLHHLEGVQRKLVTAIFFLGFSTHDIMRREALQIVAPFEEHPPYIAIRDHPFDLGNTPHKGESERFFRHLNNNLRQRFRRLYQRDAIPCDHDLGYPGHQLLAEFACRVDNLEGIPVKPFDMGKYHCQGIAQGELRSGGCRGGQIQVARLAFNRAA